MNTKTCRKCGGKIDPLWTICGACRQAMSLRSRAAALKWIKERKAREEEEPSLEEIEALIAQQRQNLPHWWTRERRKANREDDGQQEEKQTAIRIVSVRQPKFVPVLQDEDA